MDFNSVSNYRSHVHNLSSQLGGVGDKVHSVNLGTSSFGAVGQVFAGPAKDAVSHLGDQTHKVSGFVGQAGDNVDKMVKRSQQNESDVKDSFDKIGGSRTGPSSHSAPSNTRPAGPPPIKPKPAKYSGTPIQSTAPASERPSGPPPRPTAPKPNLNPRPGQTAPSSTRPSGPPPRPTGPKPNFTPNRPTGPASTTPSSAHPPAQPTPAPGPAGHGQTAPANKPSWMQTDQNGWPVQPPGRTNPKLFTEQNNVNPYTHEPEQYHSYVDQNGNRMVRVYRFAQEDKEHFWESPLRTNNNGGFGEHSAADAAHMAHEQTHNGRKSDDAGRIPFVSVTTNHGQLQQHGETWVQDVLGNKQNRLGTFEVPASSLYRPNVPSGVTRREQEWLYYDGDVPLKNNPHTFENNPYA